MKSKGASGEFAKYVSQNVFAMIGMSFWQIPFLYQRQSVQTVLQP